MTNKTNKLITTVEFYLVENLSHTYLASHYLLRALGCLFPSRSPVCYEHKPQIEDNFGNCNNWDTPRIKTNIHQFHSKLSHPTRSKHVTFATDYNFNPKPISLTNIHNINLSNSIKNHSHYFSNPKFTIHTIDTKFADYNEYTMMNPHDQYLYQLSTPFDPSFEYINSITNIQINNISLPLIDDEFTSSIYQISKTNQINHISNFQATQDEIDKAKAMQTESKPLGEIPTKHIEQISLELARFIRNIRKTHFPNLFAKHQTHRRLIPNYEFYIDLIDEAKNIKIFKPQYPLNPDKRITYIFQTLNYTKNGMFVPDNTSPHNVPAIVITKKPENEKEAPRKRLAFDFTLLNSYTKDVKSHIPTFNYIFDRLRGPGKFSTTDFKNYFDCIPLRKRDQPLSHVTTPIGEYNLTAATYGYKTISAMAQNISNHIVSDLRQYNITKSCVFVDDLFVKHRPNASPNEMKNDIIHLFETCEKHKVLLHPRKTYLFVDEVEYLGYRFTQEGTEPQRLYINKILKFHRPLTKKQIKSYLGVIQYISRYVYKLAQWSAPLNQLLTADSKQSWGTTQDKAFDTIQEYVKNIKLLHHPTDDGIFLIQTDASKYALGAVLYQRQFDPNQNKNVWKIIEFYSKQIDKGLLHHPIAVKECLAITHAMSHWRHFLLRRLFYIDTDHKNLINLFDDDENSAPLMRRQQIFITMKWVAMPFHFKIAHLEGSKIILADYLSRDGAKYNSHVESINSIHLKSPNIINESESLAYARSIQNLQNYKSFAPANAALYPTITPNYDLSPTSTIAHFLF